MLRVQSFAQTDVDLQQTNGDPRGACKGLKMIIANCTFMHFPHSCITNQITGLDQSMTNAVT